ncbi:MAG TPA: hypothetical protein VJ793_18430 [Anaerolineae bacterium]|nr:hypothetical protein [Anaerolineae bacterium]
MIPLAGILTIAFWSIVEILLVILYAIARFYQATSGQVSHYRLFVIPMILLGAGGVRYALLGDFVDDPLGDALFVAGSVFLVTLSAWLVRLMTGGRR